MITVNKANRTRAERFTAAEASRKMRQAQRRRVSIKDKDLSKIRHESGHKFLKEDEGLTAESNS